MDQLELFPSLPIFRVAAREGGDAAIYEVPARDFEEARQIVASTLGDDNCWVLASKQNERPKAKGFTHTPSPSAA